MTKSELARAISELNNIIALRKQQAEKLQNELDNFPEYPNGTLGYFWDSSSELKRIGFLENYSDSAFPYRRHDTPSLSSGIMYKHFEPIAEALLPFPVEYDGGEYPGNPDDEVRVEYLNGSFRTAMAKELVWRNTICPNPKARYWVIKKA